MESVETIKPTATSATPPTKHERKESEQETVLATTTTTNTAAVSPPPRPSPSSAGHHHQGSGNGRSQRQHSQAPSVTVPSTTTASHSNLSSTQTSELSNQNHSNRYATPPSEVRLRSPITSSSSYSPSSSSHTASSTSSRGSALRQNSSPALSSTYVSDGSAKNSTTLASSSSSREKEKHTGAATAKHTYHSPPTVVTETDKMTGTCTVVSQKPLDDQPPSSMDRKPEKPDKILLKKVDQARTSHPESTAILGTPPNSKKVKSTRRSGGKLQRSPQPPEQKIPAPSPAAPPPTTTAAVNNQGQTHVVPRKSEGFVRKESESSIKSTDSESTSSSDKLDEREDSEAVLLSVEATSESSKPKEVPQHSLAKEPNTGQTVPVTPVSESPELKTIALDVQKKEKDEPTGGGRGKGKKRSSRQPQKRDEKPKKKDRERDRDRERRERAVKEYTKSEKVCNGEEKQHQQPASGESSSSNSTEQLYEEQNDQRGDSQEADDEKSDVSSIPEKETSHKREARNLERESPKPDSPVPEHSTPQKSDRPAKKIEEDNLDSRSSPVVLVAAVPSTAFKTGRGKSSVVKQKSEEGHSESDRRSTKKSSGSRKSSDRSSKSGHHEEKGKQSHHVYVETPPTATTTVKPERREEEENEEDGSTNSRPQTLPVIDVEATEEPILSPDSGSVETDGLQHKLGVAKSAQSLPTSPHELAAHLLAKNSAIKRRSKQRGGGEKGQSAEDGHDEGDYEEDESEEGSDGDTQPASSPAVYPPMPKHPRIDHSPHKSQGPPPPPFHHHGMPQPPMAHRHMVVKPTTLSLDAEPFYPSNSNFSSKSSRQGRPRMVDPQAQDYPVHEGSATMPSPHVGAPPGFSPEDAAVYMQHGPYHEKHYPARSRPPPAHRKPSPPSPTYPSAVGEGHFPYVEHSGMEPQEHMPGFHTPPSRADMLYDGADEAGYPPMGGRQFPDQRRDLPLTGGGLDTHHVPKGGSRRVTPTGAGPFPEQYMASLHQRQQHMGGAGGGPYRSSRGERPPAGFTVTGQRSLWENPNAYRLQPLPGGEDPNLLRHQEYLRQRSILLKLYQQEQAALEAAIAREQAKRSVQTLSSLNQPYRSRSSMLGGGGKMDLSSPVADALWEGGGSGGSSLHDPHASSSQSFDDPGLSESIMRQRHLQQYLANQPPLRSRTYSGDGDIGGEFVSSPVQVPSSIGHPGLNRAPGPGSSEGRGQGQRNSLDHTSSSSSAWPSRSGSEVSCSNENSCVFTKQHTVRST